MATLQISAFSGEIPATAPGLLENSNATQAVNCSLERGELEPLRGPDKAQDLESRAVSIFRHDQDGWLTWDREVQVVKSSVFDMAGEKALGHVFMTGAKAWPSQYLAGGHSCRLGLPRPEKAPVVGLVTASWRQQCVAMPMALTGKNIQPDMAMKASWQQ